MEQVISKLSEIENTAASIMEEANLKKKEASNNMKNKIAAYDSQLEVETAKQLEQLRRDMEQKMLKQLEEQKQHAEAVLEQLESIYQINHKQYAKQLFESMIER